MTRSPPVQLTLDDLEPDDDVTFAEWFTRLPITPQLRGTNEPQEPTSRKPRRKNRKAPTGNR